MQVSTGFYFIDILLLRQQHMSDFKLKSVFTRSWLLFHIPNLRCGNWKTTAQEFWKYWGLIFVLQIEHTFRRVLKKPKLFFLRVSVKLKKSMGNWIFYSGKVNFIHFMKYSAMVTSSRILLSTIFPHQAKLWWLRWWWWWFIHCFCVTFDQQKVFSAGTIVRGSHFCKSLTCH